jgi:dienelactone hydrolase
MQSFTRAVDGFYDVGYQMTLDLRQRAQEHFSRQQREKAALTSIEAFEAHRERVRANFLNAIGGLPGPAEYSGRTPPPARVTSKLEREEFVVEKLIYESLPNFPVTAACYVPRNLQGPAPAIVMAHGHTEAGKSYPAYQAVALDLACNGFIVLAIDPIGQGERYQVVEGGARLHTSSTAEHTHAGFPFWLRGLSIARHFIWDIMRGIDYLQTRDDVDASRIGITGNSGGGTQTCYLMMCEPRLAAAVPCTFVMTLESYQKTGQPQDAEQIIRGCMAHGPDHDDYLTALAPRPVLVGAAAYDFFPIEGAREAVRRAKNIFALYGKEENVAITVAPTTHEYSGYLRQACVNWFRLHLQQKEPDFVTGMPRIFEESELWATQSGCVYMDDPDAKTVFDLLDDFDTARSSETAPERQTIAGVLGIEQAGERSAPINARIINTQTVEGYHTEKIFFFSAPEISVTGVLIHPRGATSDSTRPATLLLLEHGTDDIAASRPAIDALLHRGHRVFVFDVRGVGAVKTYSYRAEAEFETFNSEYKMGCDAMMLGLSTLGLRVFDVLRGVDYLRSRPDISAIHLQGFGSGAVFAYYASLLDDGIENLSGDAINFPDRDSCRTRDYPRQFQTLKTVAWGLADCDGTEKRLNT